MPLRVRTLRAGAVVCRLKSIAISITLLTVLFALASRDAYAQNPAVAGSDPTYQALRNLTLGGDAVTVNNLQLKRDAATFSPALGDGVFCSSRQRKGYRGGFFGRRNP